MKVGSARSILPPWNWLAEGTMKVKAGRFSADPELSSHWLRMAPIFSNTKSIYFIDSRPGCRFLY